MRGQGSVKPNPRAEAVSSGPLCLDSLGSGVSTAGLNPIHETTHSSCQILEKKGARVVNEQRKHEKVNCFLKTLSN